MGRGIGVVEFDPIGHRLAFVRAMLDDASRSGTALRVVTTPAARQSPEWHQHLDEVTPGLVVDLVPDPQGAWRFARAIRRASPCVVLDADAHLPALLAARLLGADFGMLITRPVTPKLDPGWRRRTLGKTLLCLLLRALGVNIRLLVSPFATAHPWAEIHVPHRLRLPTVLDPPLIPASHRSPAEARAALGLDAHARIWVVAGAINYTKGLPVILRAMDALRPEHHLVVAGKHDAQTSAQVAELGAGLAREGRLVTIDRMLTDAELADVLRAGDGVLVTKESGLSSGIAIGAIVNGTRVVCAAANPQRGAGFVLFDGTAEGLAASLAALDTNVAIAREDATSADSLLSLLPFRART